MLDTYVHRPSAHHEKFANATTFGAGSYLTCVLDNECALRDRFLCTDAPTSAACVEDCHLRDAQEVEWPA